MVDAPPGENSSKDTTEEAPAQGKYNQDVPTETTPTNKEEEKILYLSNLNLLIQFCLRRGISSLLS